MESIWTWLRATKVILLSFLLAACTVNPVTGQTELELVSTAQQIRIGEEQYLPSQQMEGGAYILDPALETYVKTVGQRLAAQSPANLPYEFVVLNNSIPNAWALPGGKVAVNRGLLTQLRNEAELAAVLGHEITHAAARHGAKTIERGIFLQSAVLATAITAQGTPLAETLTQGVQTGAALINQKYGRDAEREADFYGTRYMAQAGYDPYAAVTLQETFVRLSQESGSPEAQGWIDGLFASHPPSEERVANNRQLVDTLRAEGYTDGEYGADRFQAAVRTIRGDEPAYKAADEARKALRDGDFDLALKRIEAALELQPAEAQFHGLRGDVRTRQKRYEDAVTNYDRAIQRDPEFFSFYLGRGMARARLNQLDPARGDLERSVELLPTTVAYLELGRVAEAQGDTASAARYYEAAGQSPGEVGDAARAGLVRTDLAANPSRYIVSRTGQSSDGRWLVRIENGTDVNVTDVRVRVEYLTGSGASGSFERSIPHLAAGTYTQIEFPSKTGSVQQARSVVIAARVAN